MLFNSHVFILIFFPAVLVGYFFINKVGTSRAALSYLFLASLFFYGYWNPVYLPLLLSSIVFNYGFGLQLARNRTRRRAWLIFGIVFNVSLLGYFKYTDFFISNINVFTGYPLNLLGILLPLGISFFTFTQIAFLVDAYQRKINDFNFLNYGLFVTYFPHLLAGPIVHHAEMMPQFAETANKKINYHNLTLGLLVFTIGLIKKAYIADTLAEWVNNGYGRIEYLSQLEAWVLSFCYTLQLYFDFSGYTDMAIGCSLMLNIRLPENFNSPYKALDIQDFWRRWHMTLSRWLKRYIYIPLGGNRGSEFATHVNLILTFLIGGFWHGAGWTFILWGLMHGLAISVHRFWKKLNLELPNLLAWVTTLLFVNFAWIFFRANTLQQAYSLIKKMFEITSLDLAFKTHRGNFVPNLASSQINFFILLSIFIFLSLHGKNTLQFKNSYKGTLGWNILIGCALGLGILGLMRVTTFIYFQF